MHSWRQSADAYLHLGEAFVEECTSNAAMSVQRLEQVDAARAALADSDGAYNRALDQLEVRGKWAGGLAFTGCTQGEGCNVRTGAGMGVHDMQLVVAAQATLQGGKVSIYTFAPQESGCDRIVNCI